MPPRAGTDRESKLHLAALLVVTAGMMVAGVLVTVSRDTPSPAPSTRTPPIGVAATPSPDTLRDEPAR